MIHRLTTLPLLSITDTPTGIGQTVWESFSKVVGQLMEVIPNLVGAFFILLFGWLIAKLVSGLIARVLKRIGLDKLAEKLNETETFRESNLKIKPVIIIKKFLYWTLMLIFTLSAAETLGLSIITEQISSLIQYIPRLFTSFVILALGFYAADALRGMVANTCKSLGIPAWRILSSAIFYILLVAIGVTALNQAGINTDIITSNIYIILGGVVLAFSIAYGFAARSVLSSILTSFYSKGNYELGQLIEIDDYKGKIIRVDPVSITLDTGDTWVVFPLNRLLTDKVIIHTKESPAETSYIDA